jgi:hypothetical protein
MSRSQVIGNITLFVSLMPLLGWFLCAAYIDDEPSSAFVMIPIAHTFRVDRDVWHDRGHCGTGHLPKALGVK